MSAGDLHGWVFDPQARFLGLLGGGVQTGLQLTNGAPLGVYEAEAAPLVVWVLNTGSDLEVLAGDARQFTMASDLVLGAILSADRVVVIGRARQVPFELLPPLRTETLALLANAGDSLGQSYERLSPLAGRHGPPSRRITSWAPIYLSSELIDTEYGSLLNLADQLLKSWSNAGQTQYTNFAYPPPSRWPFGSRTVYEHIGSQSLTYNWNTQEFAQIYQSDYHAILSFQTTGALPLDYLPANGSTTQSEKASAVGRSYFASLNDPNLARVVQYAALYHILHTAKAINSGASSPAQLDHPASPDHRSPLIEAAALAMLRAYARVPDARFRQVADRLFETVVAHDVPRTPRTVSLLADELAAERRASLFAGASDARLEALAKLWTSPPAQPTATQQRELEACRRAGTIMQELVDIDKLRADFLAALPVRPDTWIHTSTWVASTNDSMIVGGHNIDFALKPTRTLSAPTQSHRSLAVSSPRPTTQGGQSSGWRSVRSSVDAEILDGYRGPSNVRVVRIERVDGHYGVSIGDRKFTAWTLADASDTIASVTRAQPSSLPLRLHLERFSGAEARNARAQVERAVNMKGGQHQIEAVAHGSSMTPAGARSASQMRSLRGAAVRESKIIGDKVIEAEIVAKSSGGLRGFAAKIKIMLSDKVTRAMRVRVTKLIDAVLARIRRPGTHTDISTQLQRELTARLKAEKIPASVEIVNEAGDIWIVVREVTPVRASG